MFEARRAAGYKDRCAHSGSQKDVTRGGTHCAHRAPKSGRRQEAGWASCPPSLAARSKSKEGQGGRPRRHASRSPRLFSGRGRWALLTDLCWRRTRAVCAAEGLAFIFLIIRSCTLSRKFLLKIVYSSSSSPDGRKCRFNPNRVYFKGTQKPRAGVKGVRWPCAQGLKALVFL